MTFRFQFDIIFLYMQFKGDFNINRKTIPRLVAVFLFIISLAVARINFAYTGIGIALSIIILVFQQRFLNTKASEEPVVVYTGRQKIFAIVGFCIIAALFVFMGVTAVMEK